VYKVITNKITNMEDCVSQFQSQEIVHIVGSKLFESRLCDFATMGIHNALYQNNANALSLMTQGNYISRVIGESFLLRESC